MKLFFLLLSISFSSIAFADTYVCKIAGTDDTLTLIKIRDLPVGPRGNFDSKAEYRLQKQTSELAFPSLNIVGVAKTSDVHFFFTSKDKKYEVRMYLDDAEGTFYAGDKESFLSDCIFFK